MKRDTVQVFSNVNQIKQMIQQQNPQQNPHYLDWKINQLEKERMQKPSDEAIKAELRNYRAIQSGTRRNEHFTHTFITGGQIGQRNTSS